MCNQLEIMEVLTTTVLIHGVISCQEDWDTSGLQSVQAFPLCRWPGPHETIMKELAPPPTPPP